MFTRITRRDTINQKSFYNIIQHIDNIMFLIAISSSSLSNILCNSIFYFSTKRFKYCFYSFSAPPTMVYPIPPIGSRRPSQPESQFFGRPMADNNFSTDFRQNNFQMADNNFSTDFRQNNFQMTDNNFSPEFHQNDFQNKWNVPMNTVSYFCLPT